MCEIPQHPPLLPSPLPFKEPKIRFEFVFCFKLEAVLASSITYLQGLVNLDFSAASGNSVAPLMASTSIRWIGFLRPSKSGEYTFSIQPQVRHHYQSLVVFVCDDEFSIGCY